MGRMPVGFETMVSSAEVGAHESSDMMGWPAQCSPPRFSNLLLIREKNIFKKVLTVMTCSKRREGAREVVGEGSNMKLFCETHNSHGNERCLGVGGE